MEPILLYGFPAGSSMGLIASLEWLGQPYRLSRVDMLGEMREPPYARVNARHEAVIERHDKLEAMIPNTPFLVGDRPTLADGVLIGVARWLEFHEVAEAGRWPRLAALRRRIEANPAVRFALAIEEGQTLTGSGAFLGHLSLADVIEKFGNQATDRHSS